MTLEGLPKLPGYSFANIGRVSHGVPQHLSFLYGYRNVKKSQIGIGGEPLDSDGILYQRPTDSVRFDPSLVYGKAKTYTPPVFKPHFVLYDKKCLTFKAFFKQSVHESPLETYRIRHVNIIYFLEDDNITVMEPPTPNAGFPQGRLVTKARIPRGDGGTFWHWKDLNVGMEMDIYGIVYHVCSCDNFTREYLISQGMEINENEELPPDPYIERRLVEQRSAKSNKPAKTLAEDKLYRYLEYDRKILRFKAYWDEETEECGEKEAYKIHYFLVDDTIEVAAENKVINGRDPFALLMRRMKVPKKWNYMPAQFAGCYMERSDKEVVQFFGVEDFVVGSTVQMLGRKFVIADCDAFTRKYYSECVGIEQPPALAAEKTDKRQHVEMALPAYKGLGTVEDSIQSWYHFDPQPPQLDLIRYLGNQSKKLRYTAVLDWVHPEDEGREFLLEYRLSDGTLAVHELPRRNSGFVGGRFLKPMPVPKTGSNRDNPAYITPIDLRLGGIVTIFGHRFIVTGVDLAVYRYMEANPEKFPSDQITEVRTHLVKEGYLNEDIKEVAEFRKREEIELPVVVSETAPTEDIGLKMDH